MAIKEYQKNLLYPVQVALKLLLLLFWTASLQASPLKSAILDALKRLCWQHKKNQKKERKLEMDRWGNKMLWGWSGDIEVGHRNRHGKKIHEFVENQNFLSNFEPSRRTVTSLFSTVSFEHVGASLWCLHCNEKYTSVFHLYFWLSLHSLFLPLTLPIFLTAFLCLFPSCCLTVVET